MFLELRERRPVSHSGKVFGSSEPTLGAESPQCYGVFTPQASTPPKYRPWLDNGQLDAVFNDSRGDSIASKAGDVVNV